MKTYWEYTVRIEGSPTCTLGGRETLETALQDAIKDAVYYQAVHPDKRIVIDGIIEYCQHCNNVKAVIKYGPRSNKVVRCTECKGKGASGRLGHIVFTMPDPANDIRLSFDDKALPVLRELVNARNYVLNNGGDILTSSSWIAAEKAVGVQ